MAPLLIASVDSPSNKRLYTRSSPTESVAILELKLGYYMATCDGGTDVFQLARSRCTDNSCSNCADVDAFSGVNRERGCLVEWAVNDLDKAGSVPFSVVADGECHDSGIPGLGHYVATCQDDRSWFDMSKSGCSDASCGECTKVSEPISPRQALPSLFTSVVELQCDIDAFYKEKVWSVSGSCQRPGCSSSIGSTLPVKWWPETIDDGRSVQCIYGNEYPKQYHADDRLRESMLFDSREACYSAYARVTECQPTPSPIASPDVLLESSSPENSAMGLGHGISSCLVIFLLSSITCGNPN